jgi:hypothetical protein
MQYVLRTNYISHIVYYILHIVYYILHIVYYILHTAYQTLHLTYYIWYECADVWEFTYYILHVKYYTLHIAHHILHITQHVLLITYYILHITNWKKKLPDMLGTFVVVLFLKCQFCSDVIFEMSGGLLSNFFAKWLFDWLWEFQIYRGSRNFLKSLFCPEIALPNDH